MYNASGAMLCNEGSRERVCVGAETIRRYRAFDISIS